MDSRKLLSIGQSLTHSRKLTEKLRPLRNEALSQFCTDQQKIPHVGKKNTHLNNSTTWSTKFRQFTRKLNGRHLS